MWSVSVIISMSNEKFRGYTNTLSPGPVFMQFNASCVIIVLCEVEMV